VYIQQASAATYTTENSVQKVLLTVVTESLDLHWCGCAITPGTSPGSIIFVCYVSWFEHCLFRLLNYFFMLKVYLLQ
jgi:hypothetical protein